MQHFYGNDALRKINGMRGYATGFGVSSAIAAI